MMAPLLRRAAPFAPSGDPFWPYVVCQMQFEGTEGSATFVDESRIGAVATQYGSPIITTAAGKFGRGFAGNGGSSGRALQLPSNAAYGPGTGDFTFEVFCRNDNGGQDVGIIGLGEAGSVLMLSTTTTDLRLRRTGYPNFGTVVGLDTGSLQQGIYRHIAWGRQSGVLYWHVDGVLQYSGAFTDNLAAAPISIGAWAPTGGSRAAFLGAIDGLRYTVGACRYAGGSFAPPTGPYPTS